MKRRQHVEPVGLRSLSEELDSWFGFMSKPAPGFNSLSNVPVQSCDDPLFLPTNILPDHLCFGFWLTFISPAPNCSPRQEDPTLPVKTDANDFEETTVFGLHECRV